MTVPKFVFDPTPPDPMLLYPAIRIPVEKPWRIEDKRYNKFYRQIESDLNAIVQKLSDALHRYTRSIDRGSNRYTSLERGRTYFRRKLKELQTQFVFTINIDDLNVIWDWGKPIYAQVESAQYAKLSAQIIEFRRFLNIDIDKLSLHAYSTGLTDRYHQLVQILYTRYYQMTSQTLQKNYIQNGEPPQMYEKKTHEIKPQSAVIEPQSKVIGEQPWMIGEPLLLLHAAIQESLTIQLLLDSGTLPSFSAYHAIFDYFASYKNDSGDVASFAPGDSFDYTFGLAEKLYTPRAVNYIPHIPTEPLPRVGDIYESNGKRFLGISAEKIYDFRDKLISESKRLHMPIRIIPEEMKLAMKTHIAEPYRAALFLLDRMHPILHERTYRIYHKSRASWLEQAEFEKQAEELDAWQGIPYFKPRIDSFLTALTDCKIIDNKMGDRLHIASELLDPWSMKEFHMEAQRMMETHINITQSKP